MVPCQSEHSMLGYRLPRHPSPWQRDVLPPAHCMLIRPVYQRRTASRAVVAGIFAAGWRSASHRQMQVQDSARVQPTRAAGLLPFHLRPRGGLQKTQSKGTAGQVASVRLAAMRHPCKQQCILSPKCFYVLSSICDHHGRLFVWIDMGQAPVSDLGIGSCRGAVVEGCEVQRSLEL